MSSKYAVAAIIVVLGLLALAPMGTPAEGETVWVEDITIDPDPAVVNETVTVSCTLTDETNVSKLFLNICAGGLCYPPVEMTNTEGMTWSIDTDLVTTIEEYQVYVQVQFDNETYWSTEYVHFTPVAPAPPPTDLEVNSLELGTDEVKVGETVYVYCNITDDTDIVLVQVMACQGDVCFTPVTMEKLSNGTYHAEIGPFDSTEEVKYNVTAKYSDDNLAWTSDVKFTPVESGGDGDDDGVIPTIGAVAVLAVLAGLAVTRRGKRA